MPDQENRYMRVWIGQRGQGNLDSTASEDNEIGQKGQERHRWRLKHDIIVREARTGQLGQGNLSSAAWTGHPGKDIRYRTVRTERTGWPDHINKKGSWAKLGQKNVARRPKKESWVMATGTAGTGEPRQDHGDCRIGQPEQDNSGRTSSTREPGQFSLEKSV